MDLSFQSKSEAFGAIGGSLSILLWSYVMGRILAAAPVLNAGRLASDPRRADPRTTASTVSRTVPRRRTATASTVTGPRAPTDVSDDMDDDMKELPVIDISPLRLVAKGGRRRVGNRRGLP